MQLRSFDLKKCRPKTKKTLRKYAPGNTLVKAQGIVAYKPQD
jgi:hypothetical protein